MIIAIASGKGGTGKTTIAVNLALSLGVSAKIVDCDVEEPNCHIFLKPLIKKSASVGIPVPQIDIDLCNSCGECSEICEYHAIVSLKTKPLVFPQLCHGCGGCALVCPTGAITEVERETGVVEEGTSGLLKFVQGRLNVGEAMALPVIRAVRKREKDREITIIDAPPGTSCPVITSISGCDYVVLVTEPTPFGLNDLILAVEMVRAMEIPFGVVINRCDIGDASVMEYCREQTIDILIQFPDDRRIAEAYSRGNPIINTIPQLHAQFETLYQRILTSKVGYENRAAAFDDPQYSLK
jgi:MinD superfamily P-loop ATPase